MPVLNHIKTENDVHELVFGEATRDAVDRLLTVWKRYLRDEPGDGLYLLVDLRASGMLPLAYLTDRLRDTVNRAPEHTPAYVALVLDDPALLTMARSMLHTLMRRENIQYFTQIDKARFWIQIEQNKNRRH